MSASKVSDASKGKYVEYLARDYGSQIAGCGKQLLKEEKTYDFYVDFVEAAFERLEATDRDAVWVPATTSVQT